MRIKFVLFWFRLKIYLVSLFLPIRGFCFFWVWFTLQVQAGFPDQITHHFLTIWHMYAAIPNNFSTYTKRIDPILSNLFKILSLWDLYSAWYTHPRKHNQNQIGCSATCNGNGSTPLEMLVYSFYCAQHSSTELNQNAFGFWISFSILRQLIL